MTEFERSVLSATARNPGQRFFALVDLAPHESLLKKLVQANDSDARLKSLFDGTPEEALLDGVLPAPPPPALCVRPE